MNLKHCLAIWLALVAVSMSSGSGWSQDEPEVVGFSIAKKDAGSDFGQSYIPGTKAGLQIYLRVALPKNTILKIDDEKTSLKVVDSSGKELAADENSSVSFFASIAEDKHSVIVPVQCTDIPGEGVTSLSVSGDISLNCGADAKTESVDVKLAEGNELKLGPVTAKVSQIGEGFELDTKRIDLESKDSFDQIETLVFLDSKGKEIETTGAGGGSFGFAGDMTYSRGYSIKGAPESIAQAKISFFQKIDVIQVPVQVTFSLGLHPY